MLAHSLHFQIVYEFICIKIKVQFILIIAVFKRVLPGYFFAGAFLCFIGFSAFFAVSFFRFFCACSFLYRLIRYGSCIGTLCRSRSAASAACHSEQNTNGCKCRQDFLIHNTSFLRTSGNELRDCFRKPSLQNKHKIGQCSADMTAEHDPEER